MITLQLDEKQVSALKDAIDWVTRAKCLRPDIIETLSGITKNMDSSLQDYPLIKYMSYFIESSKKGE